MREQRTSPKTLVNIRLTTSRLCTWRVCIKIIIIIIYYVVFYYYYYYRYSLQRYNVISKCNASTSDVGQPVSEKYGKQYVCGAFNPG